LNHSINVISYVTNNTCNKMYISIETAINACDGVSWEGWDSYSRSVQCIRFSKAGCKAGTAVATKTLKNHRGDPDEDLEHSTQQCSVQPRVQPHCSRVCSLLLFMGAWVLGKGGGIWDGRPLVPGQTINNLPFPPTPKWQLQSAKF
jgi:hypothetical protein